MHRALSREQFLNAGQLPMFMSAREITSRYTPWGGDRRAVNRGNFNITDETDDEFWSRKGGEARDSGLTASVAQDGVVHPVWLGNDGPKPSVIVGGHHRIAAALDTDPDRLMPVLHNEGGVQEAQFAGNRGPWRYR